MPSDVTCDTYLCNRLYLLTLLSFSNLNILDFSSNSSSSEDEHANLRRRRRRSSDNFGDASPTSGDSADPDWEDDEDYYDPWEDDEDYNHWDEEDFEDPDDFDEEFLANEKVALLMAEAGESHLSSLGHQFEDMMLSCTFRGISCR